MTPTDAAAQADVQYAQFEPVIIAHQTAFVATWREYWRGVRTHTVLPADGAASYADQGQINEQSDMPPWPAQTFTQPLYAAVQIEPYHDAFGSGYVVMLALTVAGVEYRRSIAYGPHIYLNAPWTEVR